MLKKSERLTRALFEYLRGPGRYFHSAHFSLRTADSTTGLRIGVSVSKKVAKRANIRNRIRRRAYEAVRGLIPELPKKLFLISAKAGAEGLKGAALKQELAELLKKG
ncbi:MAG: Ribonuclease protein component [Parcubacteria group bacterium]|nr:Ribonuclease protein component [Parcubacteria group bacterium]